MLELESIQTFYGPSQILRYPPKGDILASLKGDILALG